MRGGGPSSSRQRSLAWQCGECREYFSRDEERCRRCDTCRPTQEEMDREAKWGELPVAYKDDGDGRPDFLKGPRYGLKGGAEGFWG